MIHVPTAALQEEGAKIAVGVDDFSSVVFSGDLLIASKLLLKAYDAEFMTQTPFIVKLFSLSLLAFGSLRMVSSSAAATGSLDFESASSFSIHSGRTHCGAAGFLRDLDDTLMVEMWSALPELPV